MGLLKKIVERSWEYIKGKREKREIPAMPVIEPLVKYTEEEREELKKMMGNFLDFFPRGDLLTFIDINKPVDKRDDFNDFDERRLPYAWTIFPMLEGRRSRDYDVTREIGSFRSLELPMPEGYKPVFKGFSEEDAFKWWWSGHDEKLMQFLYTLDERFNPSTVGNIRRMILGTPQLSSQKIFEKQRMFDVLQQEDILALIQETYEFEYFHRMLWAMHPRNFKDFNVRMLMGLRDDVDYCFERGKESMSYDDSRGRNYYLKSRKLGELLIALVDLNARLTGRTFDEWGISNDVDVLQQLIALQKEFAAIPETVEKSESAYQTTKKVIAAVRHFNELTDNLYFHEVYEKESKWQQRTYDTKDPTDTYLLQFPEEERLSIEKALRIYRYDFNDEKEGNAYRRLLQESEVHRDLDFGIKRKKKYSHTHYIRQRKKLVLYKDIIAELIKEKIDAIYAGLELISEEDLLKEPDLYGNELPVPQNSKVPFVSLFDESCHPILKDFYDKYNDMIIDYSRHYHFQNRGFGDTGYPSLLLWTPYIISDVDYVPEFLDKLRQLDSVYLNQFANYLEEIWTRYLGDFRTGIEYFRIIKPIQEEIDMLAAEKEQLEKGADPQVTEQRINELGRKIRKLYETMPGFEMDGAAHFNVELSKLTDILTYALLIKLTGKERAVFSDDGTLEVQDGLNSYAAVPIEEQEANTTYFTAQVRGELLSGTNTSGKTFNGTVNTWNLLEALATGYSEGRVTMPNLKRIFYFDRVTTKLFRNLSAWGTEVTYLKECIEEFLATDGLAYLFLDEVGSSTSPKYQSAVSYVLSEWFLEQGNIYYQISSHNHDFIDALLAAYQEYLQVSHFKTTQNPDKEAEEKIIRHFKKVPGHDESHAIAVAEDYGLGVLINEILDLIPEDMKRLPEDDGVGEVTAGFSECNEADSHGIVEEAIEEAGCALQPVFVNANEVEDEYKFKRRCRDLNWEKRDYIVYGEYEGLLDFQECVKRINNEGMSLCKGVFKVAFQKEKGMLGVWGISESVKDCLVRVLPQLENTKLIMIDIHTWFMIDAILQSSIDNEDKDQILLNFLSGNKVFITYEGWARVLHVVAESMERDNSAYYPFRDKVRRLLGWLPPTACRHESN